MFNCSVKWIRMTNLSVIIVSVVKFHSTCAPNFLAAYCTASNDVNSRGNFIAFKHAVKFTVKRGNVSSYQ